MPLKAKIDGEIVFGPEIPLKKWEALKQLQRKEGFSVSMICCNSRGHLRTSKNGLQFFYHKIKPESCSWAPESVKHEEMKYAIYEVCKAGGWDVKTEHSSPDNSPDNKWRADIFATKNNRKIVFEVQFSKISQSILKERELKFVKAGVESYWLLKDFFGNNTTNYLEEMEKMGYFSNLPSISDNSNLNLNYEKYYFIYKKIRSVGIEESNITLFTSENSSIQLKDWVNSCLSGKYLEYLKKCAENFQQKTKELEKVMPLFEKISNISINLRGFEKTLTIDKCRVPEFLS